MMKPEVNASRAAPNVLADETTVLLDGAFATKWPMATANAVQAHSLRGRVLERVGRSARASRAFVTVRGQASGDSRDGVRSQVLYRSACTPPRRPGEPMRVRVLELAAGARCEIDLGAAGARCEWLALSGSIDVAATLLTRHDYHLGYAETPTVVLSSLDGGKIYLREASADKDECPAESRTVRDRGASWADFAPGIKRRVLWQRGAEAAMLYHVMPGAAVPCHGHQHDEECLMLEGEVFLDDVLLRSGEYQLAPAGSTHDGVSTDTGGVLFAHGDVDLALLAR